MKSENAPHTRAPLGEFEKIERPASLRYYRNLFLHLPSTLYATFLPTLGEAVGSLSTADFAPPSYETFVEDFERYERISAAVQPWQNQWRIMDPWISHAVAAALCTVPVEPAVKALDRVHAAWRVFDERPRPFRAAYPPSGRFPWNTTLGTDPQPLDFVFRARWYAERESREDIERDMDARYQREKAAYLDSIEDQLRAAGLKRTPKKRAGKGGDENRHIEWLVRYQVGRERQKTIARAAGVDEKSITAGIAVARELIGLSNPRSRRSK